MNGRYSIKLVHSFQLALLFSGQGLWYSDSAMYLLITDHSALQIETYTLGFIRVTSHFKVQITVRKNLLIIEKRSGMVYVIFHLHFGVARRLLNDLPCGKSRDYCPISCGPAILNLWYV